MNSSESFIFNRTVTTKENTFLLEVTWKLSVHFYSSKDHQVVKMCCCCCRIAVVQYLWCNASSEEPIYSGNSSPFHSEERLLQLFSRRWCCSPEKIIELLILHINQILQAKLLAQLNQMLVRHSKILWSNHSHSHSYNSF